MNLREQIETTFKDEIFDRPLFYRYPQGLRFELSEGENSIEQFLRAHRKALTICEDIFVSESELVVCIRFWNDNDGSIFANRILLRELRSAGIKPNRDRCIWPPKINNDDMHDYYTTNCIAFSVPRTQLQNLLWCALGTSFQAIRPNPGYLTGCLIYLFNMTKKIAVFPYDDRGMDVVGENRDELLSLYKKYNHHLLDCNRGTMETNFSTA
jgi:Domain of unknown function (DUF3885)